MISFVSCLKSMKEHKEFTTAVFNSSYRADLYLFLLQFNDMI